MIGRGLRRFFKGDPGRPLGGAWALAVNSIEAWLGLSAVWAVVSFVASPAAFHNNAVEAVFGGWVWMWLGLYALAGAQILYGLFRPRRAAEASGLVILAGVQCLVVLSLFVAFGAASLVSTAMSIALAVACIVRAALLLRPPAVLVVRPPK